MNALISSLLLIVNHKEFTTTSGFWLSQGRIFPNMANASSLLTIYRFYGKSLVLEDAVILWDNRAKLQPSFISFLCIGLFLVYWQI